MTEIKILLSLLSKGRINRKGWFLIIMSALGGLLLISQSLLKSEFAILTFNIVIAVSAFIATIASVIEIVEVCKDSSNKNVLAEHKKRDFFSRKVPSQSKHISSKLFKEPTNFVRIKIIRWFFIPNLFIIVYYMIFLVDLSLKFI